MKTLRKHMPMRTKAQDITMVASGKVPNVPPKDTPQAPIADEYSTQGHGSMARHIPDTKSPNALQCSRASPGAGASHAIPTARDPADNTTTHHSQRNIPPTVSNRSMPMTDQRHSDAVSMQNSRLKQPNSEKTMSLIDRERNQHADLRHPSTSGVPQPRGIRQDHQIFMPNTGNSQTSPTEDHEDESITSHYGDDGHRNHHGFPPKIDGLRALPNDGHSRMEYESRRDSAPRTDAGSRLQPQTKNVVGTHRSIDESGSRFHSRHAPDAYRYSADGLGARIYQETDRVYAGAPEGHGFVRENSTVSSGGVQVHDLALERMTSTRSQADMDASYVSTTDRSDDELDTPADDHLAGSRELTQEFSWRDFPKEDQERELRDAFRKESKYLAKIKLLEAKVAEQSKQHQEMKQRWEGAVDALVQFRQESTSKLDDESLRRTYKEILFAVQNWAEMYCHSDPIQRLGRRNKAYMKRLTPTYHTYIQNAGLRRFLVQSLLMNWLSSEVLTFDRDVGLWWAGTLREGLTVLYTQLEPAKSFLIPEMLGKGVLQPAYVREYAAWKARSAHLVSRVASPRDVEEHTKAILAGLQKAVIPFVTQLRRANAWAELLDIIRKAVALDQELCKSRALFTAHCWNDRTVAGMKFDENFMEAAAGSPTPTPGMRVDLVLAPALSKTGTADGDLYETFSYISKWIVVCSEPPPRAG